jgi:hypothetical protein
MREQRESRRDALVSERTVQAENWAMCGGWRRGRRQAGAYAKPPESLATLILRVPWPSRAKGSLRGRVEQ